MKAADSESDTEALLKQLQIFTEGEKRQDGIFAVMNRCLRKEQADTKTHINRCQGSPRELCWITTLLEYGSIKVMHSPPEIS